jgi:hypothetical protein
MLLRVRRVEYQSWYAVGGLSESYRFKSDYLPGSTEMRLCAGTIPENYGVMRYIIGIF